MRQFPKQFNQVMMVAENFRYKKPFLLIKEMLNKENSEYL